MTIERKHIQEFLPDTLVTSYAGIVYKIIKHEKARNKTDISFTVVEDILRHKKIVVSWTNDAIFADVLKMPEPEKEKLREPFKKKR